MRNCAHSEHEIQLWPFCPMPGKHVTNWEGGASKTGHWPGSRRVSAKAIYLEETPRSSTIWQLTRQTGAWEGSFFQIHGAPVGTRTSSETIGPRIGCHVSVIRVV